MYVVSNLCVIRGRCWRESLTWGGRRCLNPTRVSACHDSTTLPPQATNLPAVTNAPSHRTVFTVYPTLRGGATRTTPSPLTNNMGMFLLVDYRDTTKENAYFTATFMMSDILKIFFEVLFKNTFNRETFLLLSVISAKTTEWNKFKNECLFGLKNVSYPPNISISNLSEVLLCLTRWSLIRTGLTDRVSSVLTQTADCVRLTDTRWPNPLSTKFSACPDLLRGLEHYNSSCSVSR